MLTQRLLGVRNPVGMLEILPQSAARTECTGKLTKIARNNMRAMKKGDLAFFYHSNCKKPGIVGIMEIVQEHSVDGQRYGKGLPVSDSSRSILLTTARLQRAHSIRITLITMGSPPERTQSGLLFASSFAANLMKSFRLTN